MQTATFASTDGFPKVFRSTNLGFSWEQSDSGMSAPGVYAFFTYHNTIFAGAYWGFYLSTNNGVSWSEASEGLSDRTLYALAIDSPYVLAGGFEKGVWRRPLSELVISLEDGDANLPAHFALKQNFPNPFNPSTRISFELPFNSMVSLTILDFLGREIAVLISEELTSGHHSVRWTATGLASGVYLYRLRGGGLSETKKLVLLR